MIVQTFLPSPSIAAYVSDIVALENSNAYGEAMLPLIARGSPSITFQLTDPGPFSGGTKMDNLVLYGQNIKPIELHTSGHVTIIAFFLYPAMLSALFGLNAKELTDTHIDLHLVQPSREMNLKEQLLNTSGLQQRIQLITGYIKKLAGLHQKSAHDTILHATELIRKNKGLISMLQVQKELYTTERTLQRLFEFHIGVSPKTFGRICQFHHTLQCLQQTNFSGMAGIAYENGYADQSHFIRSFKEFTNHTPQEYIKLASDFPG